MTNAGYPQFVAQDARVYVELAVRWAGRLQELAEIRAGMREKVRRSPTVQCAGICTGVYGRSGAHYRPIETAERAFATAHGVCLLLK